MDKSQIFMQSMHIFRVKKMQGKLTLIWTVFPTHFLNYSYLNTVSYLYGWAHLTLQYVISYNTISKR